jgi:hypothetical protein
MNEISSSIVLQMIVLRNEIVYLKMRLATAYNISRIDTIDVAGSCCITFPMRKRENDYSRKLWFGLYNSFTVRQYRINGTLQKLVCSLCFLIFQKRQPFI